MQRLECILFGNLYPGVVWQGLPQSNQSLQIRGRRGLPKNRHISRSQFKQERLGGSPRNRCDHKFRLLVQQTIYFVKDRNIPICLDPRACCLALRDASSDTESARQRLSDAKIKLRSPASTDNSEHDWLGHSNMPTA